MSDLKDARVLSAFRDGIQRPYMLGVEQRLTSASKYIDDLEENGATIFRSIYTGSGQFTTTSTTYVDTSLQINLTSVGGKSVLLFFSWDDFWVSSAATAIAYVGVSLDGGTEEVLATTYKAASNSNTYGICVTAAWNNVPAGVHNYNIRAKTSGGTLYLGTSSGNKFVLAAMEI